MSLRKRLELVSRARRLSLVSERLGDRRSVRMPELGKATTDELCACGRPGEGKRCASARSRDVGRKVASG